MMAHNHKHVVQTNRQVESDIRVKVEPAKLNVAQTGSSFDEYADTDLIFIDLIWLLPMAWGTQPLVKEDDEARVNGGYLSLLGGNWKMTKSLDGKCQVLEEQSDLAVKLIVPIYDIVPQSVQVSSSDSCYLQGHATYRDELSHQATLVFTDEGLKLSFPRQRNDSIDAARCRSFRTRRNWSGDERLEFGALMLWSDWRHSLCALSAPLILHGLMQLQTRRIAKRLCDQDSLVVYTIAFTVFWVTSNAANMGFHVFATTSQGCAQALNMFEDCLIPFHFPAATPMFRYKIPESISKRLGRNPQSPITLNSKHEAKSLIQH